MSTKPRDFGTYEQWRAYGLKKGYDKLSRGEVRRRDRSYYQIGWRHDWLDLFITNTQVRKWNSFDEWKKYGELNDYFRITIGDLMGEDGGFVAAGYRHHLPSGDCWIAEIDFPKRSLRKSVPKKRVLQSTKKRSWVVRGFDNWKKYGQKHGYHNLARGELQDEDPGFYGIGMTKKFPDGRRWMDELIAVPIKTADTLSRFIEQTPEAQALAELVHVDGYASDIADLFADMWPQRFPSAAELARNLPGAVPKITGAIKPFDLYRARELFERLKAARLPIKHNLEDALYLILCDTYQMSFNENPEKALKEIKQFARNPLVKGLASRVLDFYEEIYKFKIPGYGSLQRRQVG